MFFSFGDFDKDPEKINQKLSDIDNPPPLEELLIEDGIIEELQNKNEKLIKYLNKEKIKQMIDYIIKEPKEEDHNKGHKFPFVCSKLFNVEEIKIMKFFFKTNKELLNEKDDDNLTEKKNSSHNFFFDLNPDDKVNIEGRFNTFKDKEININEIQMNDKNGEYNDNNLDNEDTAINNDEINLDKEINNEENEDFVNIEDNEDNKNNDNNNKENEEKEKQEEKEEEVNTNNKKDGENKEICLIKTPDVPNNNSMANKRYDSPSEKNPEKEKENKSDNNNMEIDLDKKYPEDKIEILDYLFSFLKENSELNYVLCGYFSSLMNNLFNINYISIIKYLFIKRKDILKRFIYHSYRKSIAETLCKIIKYEDKFKEENIDNKNDYNQKEFALIRMEIIKDIFEKIEINMETEKLYSLSFIINDLIENKKIFDLMVNNKSIIHSLVNKQLNNIILKKTENEKDEKINDDKNNNSINNIKEKEKEEIICINKKSNFIIIIDIIINWLNNIKKYDMQTPMLLYEVNDDLDEEDDLVQQGANDNAIPELHHTALSQALFDIMPNLIKHNFNKNNQNTDNKNEEIYIIQSYNDFKLKPLGLYKIKIVEILTSLITYCKNIPNEYDNLLINSNFFENAFNYIFEYQWNNLYQESFFQLLKTLLSFDKEYPYHEIAADYLFSKIFILKTIMTNLNNIKNDNENEGNTGKGYTAFLISLSYKINALIGGNYVNLNKSFTKEGSMTFKHKGESGKNNAIDLFYHFDFNNKFEKNDKDKEEIKPVNYIQKYCNEEWNNFFKDNIVNKIKIYEEKLCQINNKNDDDLFMNSFDDDIGNNNNEEKENLLGRYKNRDEELFDDNININTNTNNGEDDDLVNNDINEINDQNTNIKNNNKNIDKNLRNTDMEINLNDFMFMDDNEDKNKDENKNDKNYNDNSNNNDKSDNINKENEEINNIDYTYNTVNFWKKTLEKENNSYINNLGEEAMNDLSE